MNRFLGILAGLSLLLSACNQAAESSQGEGFLTQVDQKSSGGESYTDMAFFQEDAREKPVAFESLPVGSVRPLSWIKNLMQEDLQRGMVGNLPLLYPGIAKDDLYGKNRRASLGDVPNMGDLVLTGAEWEQSILWWNAETIGNWWDGFVRHAYLLRDSSAMLAADSIINHLLASQDTDGYIGIYQDNLRYQHQGSNGELWAQTTALRAILAYYEMTGRPEVLGAAERAVQRTIQAYGKDGQDPYRLSNEFGGASHGLMFSDVCESLYRITAKPLYRDFAVHLYASFSRNFVNRAFDDLRYPYLLSRDSLFTGHGVHTYEQFRSLAAAQYYSGYPQLDKAMASAQHKLNQVILPSGAGHGNEWLLGLRGDADETSVEYCSMLELRNSYFSLFQKTGSAHFAEAAERITYNAMMGFRNQEGTALCYGKGDNCLILDGHHHAHGKKQPDPRFKYSPTHSEPAVCCVPNYSRSYPYWLDNMWFRQDSALVLSQFGPSVLECKHLGQKVKIEQITEYPFSDQILIQWAHFEPIELDLLIRIPEHSPNFSLVSEGAEIIEEDGFIRLRKLWRPGDRIEINLQSEVMEHEIAQDEVYLQRGALVYALPIPHREEQIKAYDLSGFGDYYCFPQDPNVKKVPLPIKGEWRYKEGVFNTQEIWFAQPPRLESEELSLVPLGSTILRQLSFPKDQDL